MDSAVEHMNQVMDPNYDLTQIEDPQLQQALTMLRQQMAGQDVNEVIKSVINDQVQDQETTKAFMLEDLDFHKVESDFKK